MSKMLIWWIWRPPVVSTEYWMGDWLISWSSLFFSLCWRCEEPQLVSIAMRTKNTPGPSNRPANQSLRWSTGSCFLLCQLLMFDIDMTTNSDQAGVTGASSSAPLTHLTWLKGPPKQVQGQCFTKHGTWRSVSGFLIFILLVTYIINIFIYKIKKIIFKNPHISVFSGMTL